MFQIPQLLNLIHSNGVANSSKYFFIIRVIKYISTKAIKINREIKK
jgi:hypothetical protein